MLLRMEDRIEEFDYLKSGGYSLSPRVEVFTLAIQTPVFRPKAIVVSRMKFT